MSLPIQTQPVLRNAMNIVAVKGSNVAPSGIAGTIGGLACNLLPESMQSICKTITNIIPI